MHEITRLHLRGGGREEEEGCGFVFRFYFYFFSASRGGGTLFHSSLTLLYVSLCAACMSKAALCLTVAPNPILAALIRFVIVCSNPAKAPPQINNTSFVSNCIKSPRGFFLPPSFGTLTTEPSTNLSKACCTPSPDTSRVMLTFSLLRLI